MTFEPIKNVLRKVLAEKKMAAKFSAAEICSVAEKLFLAELPQISGKFVVKFLKNSILHVAVANSSIAAEMRLAETIVRDSLNQRGAKIKSIRYESGLPPKILPF
ncbi:MAG: DUF721 domain-containing protein [Candidatus Peribacteraceae bacterium]|nr:DUF721 domain-containing protein [Candidatus Peribacteraceae bacterium]